MSKAAQLSQSYSSPRVFADVSAIAAARDEIGRVLELAEGARYEVGSADLGSGILMANGLYANLVASPVFVSLFGNDSAAIQSAVDAGRHVIFDGETYTITTTINVPSNRYLDIGTAEIDARNGTSTGVFSLQGTEGTEVLLSSNADEEDLTVTASDATGFAIGDLIRLASDDTIDSQDTSSTIGEFNYINDIAGNVITLRIPVQNNYTTANGVYINTVQPVENVTIDGGVFNGNTTENNGLALLNADVCKGIRILNLTASLFDTTCLSMIDTIESMVSGCRISDARSSGTAYGINVGNASQDVIISGSIFNSVRHAFTTTNGSITDGIPKRITFDNNHVVYSAPATGGSTGDAIDTHSAAKDITISNNTVTSASGQGINVECYQAIIINNHIISAGGNGIGIHNETDLQGRFTVRGNVIESHGRVGIEIIKGKRGTTATTDFADVSENTVKQSPSNYGFLLSGVDGIATLDNNKSLGNSTTALRLESPGTTIITGGIYESPAIAIRYVTTSANAIISGVRVFGGGSTGISVNGTSAITTNCIVSGFTTPISNNATNAVNTNNITV